MPVALLQLQRDQLASRVVGANPQPLGSLIAAMDGVRIHKKREWSSKRALFFGEHGILLARTRSWNAHIAFRNGQDDIPGYPPQALPEFADRVAGLHPENRLIPIESVIDARYHERALRSSSLVLALADGSQQTFRWSGIWMLHPQIEQLALVNQPTLMRVMFGDLLTIA